MSTYVDPAIVGSWAGVPDTLVLLEAGVLEQPASTQNDATIDDRAAKIVY